MKTIAAFFTLATLLTAPLWSQLPAEPPLTTVTFSETVFDFGVVEHGTHSKHRFVVTNTGSEVLQIDNAKSGCGCIVCAWTQDPIKPGESGWVEVTFLAGQMGPFNKQINLQANIEPNPMRLTIKGEVKKTEAPFPMEAQPVSPGEH